MNILLACWRCGHCSRPSTLKSPAANSLSSTRALFEEHPGILRVNWVPRVRREERVAFERAAVLDGVAGYQIKAAAPEGAVMAVTARDDGLVAVLPDAGWWDNYAKEGIFVAVPVYLKGMPHGSVVDRRRNICRLHCRPVRSREATGDDSL